MDGGAEHSGFSTDTKLFCTFEEEITLGTSCRTPANMQTVVLVHSGHQCLLQNIYFTGVVDIGPLESLITLNSNTVLLETKVL